MLVVLVGNKKDMQERAVSREMGESLANELHALYRETSALTGEGVSEVFEDACEEFCRNYNTANPGADAPVRLTERKTESGCC